MEKIKVPEIRLEGFDGEWKRCDLEHIAIVNPKENLPDVFEYVDLESVVATKMIFHRTENKNTAPSRAQRLAKKGDIFFQTVRPYQKNNFLFEGADNPFVFSTGYAQIRTEVNGKFLLNVLQSATFVNDVIANCKGTGYPAINPNDLAVLPFYIPVDEIEQKAIGEYFANLDNLIYNAEDRHTKLLALKKSLLQKMFPQEGESVPRIRFEGVEGEWERVKFGDIVTMFEDKVETPTDGYFRLGIRSWAKGTFHTYVSAGEELSTAQMHRVSADKFIVNITFAWEHAVAITDENDAGKLVSHRFPQFSFQNDNRPKFFRYIISGEQYRQHLALSSPGGAGRNRVLDINEMLRYELRIPQPNEQQKIADYFDNLDNLIEAQEQKITKLQQMKSALLQKMFV